MPERTCSTDGCDDVARGRGLCWKHYKRLQRAGGVVRPSLADRLWRQIEKRDDGCWIWTGEISASGYGRIAVGARGKRTVHRLVYELEVGPIGAGLELDHLCRVRACCNPAHTWNP